LLLVLETILAASDVIAGDKNVLANWQRAEAPEDVATAAAAPAVLRSAITEFLKRGDHW
jgi:hypothetical protein